MNFNIVKLDAYQHPYQNPIIRLILLPVLLTTLYELNKHIPLTIPDDKKDVINNDWDYIQYYSPFIFGLTIHILFCLWTASGLLKLLYLLSRHLSIQHTYFLYINRQQHLSDKIHLYIINTLVYSYYSLLFILHIYILFMICSFFPSRYNPDISPIFNDGFIIVSSLYIILFSVFIIFGVYKIYRIYKNNDDNNSNSGNIHSFDPITQWIENNSIEIGSTEIGSGSINCENNNMFCVICQTNCNDSSIQAFRTYVKIPECNHIYHKVCLKKWFAIKTSCPLCNRTIII